MIASERLLLGKKASERCIFRAESFKEINF